MPTHKALIPVASCAACAVLYLVFLVPTAHTYPPFLKKAQALGMPATDCTYCHVQPQGGEGWNERGQWLMSEKKRRSAAAIDVAWLKEYKADGAAAKSNSAAATTAPAAAAGTTPEVGSPAPDFSLTTNEGQTANLKDFRGKWVVLYFYPKDFTSGCTLQARNFQRDLAKYEQAGAVILGVSVDSAESHKSFCAKEGLSFKLLSDPDAKISTAYGSVMEHQGNKLSARNTFIIDPEGKVAKVFTGVKPAANSEEVLVALAELQKK